MKTPLQLRWHNVDPSDALASQVREETERLGKFWDRITGCAVTLEAPSRHHRHSGSQYRVRIELSAPGGRIVVGRDPRRSRLHGDLYAAVKAAFREARRQIEDRVRRLDRRVKLHLPPAEAKVARLFREDGYGFLRTPDGRDVYFHQRSVLRGAFPQLRVGSLVRFAEEQGDEGPQASTVEPVRRRSAREGSAGGAGSR
jgi:cold shock CspA family protein